MSGSRTYRPARSLVLCLGAWSAIALLAGCGTTAARQATDQMLASDAVDHAVSNVDFSPLAGQKVFFDTKYLDQPPGLVVGVGVVNTTYIASALRQHMLAAGVLLADKADNADIIVEARVGILGADRHDLTYGLPASNAGNIASTAATAATQLPIVIPEVSIARKVDQTAAAKIACYAYARDTRERIWQSGTSLARSNSKDTWIFGAGPFQKSSVEDGVHFAGSNIWAKAPKMDSIDDAFKKSMVFKRGHQVEPKPTGEIQQASAEVKPAADSKKTDPAKKEDDGKTAVVEPKPVEEIPRLMPVDRASVDAPLPHPKAAGSPMTELPAPAASEQAASADETRLPPWRRNP